MIFISCFLLSFFTFVYSQNCTNSYTCQIELYDQLLKRSRPSIRPVENDPEKINVNIGFSLLRLVSVNEQDAAITIRGHINQTWNTTTFSWNSSLYSNVQHFRAPAHLIWTPKIELLNPTTIIDFEENHFVDVQANGLFELSYSSLFTIPCDFDLTNFPFDQQTCTFKIGSTLYNTDEMAITKAIDFVIDEPNLMPNGYYFISHTIDQKSTFFAGFDRNYDQITIELIIHRRSTYFIRLISWPGAILILLTLTTFFLPPNTSERIIFSSLLLVCQFILLGIFAFYIPKRVGTKWPWMGRTIFYDIGLTTMILMISVLVRRISDGKHYSNERPPGKIRSFAFTYLAKLVGFKELSFSTLIIDRDFQYDRMELTRDDSALEPLRSVSNNSTTATTNDPDLTYTMSRNINTIKEKMNTLIHERNIHQEWLLLAHIINRVCFIIYLFFLSFSIGHHLFL